ncbi:MAG: DegT/DnrJ/EryC1/StrS aminotransferase, partial [Deltaproteobacteria bacterium]|nr:DegT/DnrJ/EryC1/StrS aminotransferase [Deltaproteobacteria bacterium]
DDALAEHLRRLRSHGMTSVTWDRHKGHAWSYDVVDLGYNYRLDEIRSALGRVQLSKLDYYNEHRQKITVLYREWLQALVPAIKIPFRNHPGKSACHLMSILLPSGTDRRQFMDSMKERGIQTSIHYPPIHHFEAYRSNGQQTVSLPTTEAIAARELTLPLYPTMSSDDIVLVVRSVQGSLQEQ